MRQGAQAVGGRNRDQPSPTAIYDGHPIHWVQEIVSRESNGVAQSAGTEQGQHNIGTIADPPFCERLTSVCRGNLRQRWEMIGMANDTPQPDDAVDQKLFGLQQRSPEVTLQSVINETNRKLRVLEYVVEAFSHRSGHHFFVALGNRAQSDGVDPIV